jgi:hypothetical protein
VEGIPHALVEFDGWMFLATEHEGLLVFDVSKPASPVLAAQYLEYENVRGLALMPPYLFLGGQEMLWMVNIADPLAIHNVKQIQGMGLIRGIFADTQFLYLAEENGFSVISLYSDRSKTVNIED